MPQTFLISDLRKSHTKEMIEAGELLHLLIALIADSATPKNMQWHAVHDLREYEFAGVHDLYTPDELQGNAQISNKYSSR